MTQTMKRLLLLGGMTPDVTVLYYNAINRVVRSALGGRNNAPLFMYSTNLETMIGHASKGDWDSFAAEYVDAAAPLVDSKSVDGVVVCAILAHKATAQLTRALEPAGIPLLHIADFLAEHLASRHPGIRTLGLLGPRATMEDAEDTDFFVGRLQRPETGGFRVLVPDTDEARREVNRGMLEEVAKGAASVTESTRAMFVDQARKLIERGAEAIVLGSTDLGFVIGQKDLGDKIPVIDPATVHAEQVAQWALAEE